MGDEETDVEVCCVCLDSLSVAPVVVLLLHKGARACPHYLHSSCAERLRPRKCPLCRVPFDRMSAPISRDTFVQVEPYNVVAGLCRLQGTSQCKADVASSNAVVQLLAATIPVRQTSLQRILEEVGVGAHQAGVNGDQFAKLLSHFGLQRVARPSKSGRTAISPEMRAAGYSMATRLVRRLRWALLKGVGAAGAASHGALLGMCLGVFLGILGAVPQLDSRRLQDLFDHIDGDQMSSVLVLFALAIFSQLIWLSTKNPKWVKRGLRLGAVFGALFGWCYALAMVNPERHSYSSVFWAGVAGTTFWHHLPHMPIAHSVAPSQRLDVFAPVV